MISATHGLHTKPPNHAPLAVDTPRATHAAVTATANARVPSATVRGRGTVCLMTTSFLPDTGAHTISYAKRV